MPDKHEFVGLDRYRRYKGLRENLGMVEEACLDCQLLVAACQGEPKKVETLLRQGADENARDSEGFTPLMLAARNGHPQTAHTLLYFRAIPSLANDKGETALTLAISSASIKAAKTIKSYLLPTKDLQETVAQAIETLPAKGYNITYNLFKAEFPQPA